MTELAYLLCGLSAGVLAGYLGLGGGVIMVPYMTLLLGLEIKEAVPISVAAMTANSIAVSNEYLKKKMVDLSIATTLALFVILGFITGSILIDFIPASVLRIGFSLLLFYTAYNFAFRSQADRTDNTTTNGKLSPQVMLIAYVVGTIAALLGIGGGIMMIPVLYLVCHLPLAVSRGTWSFTYGFAAASATLIYVFSRQLDLNVVCFVVAGILVGGKIGGFLGTKAKPKPVKIIFLILLLYSAIKLGYPALQEIL